MVSGTGVTLLSLSYAGSGYLQSVTARNHNGIAYATITYTIETINGVPCLTKVSQLNSPTAFQWEYGYEVRAGIPYLRTVKVPHPNGSGQAMSQILYGANGAVVMLIDGNSNVRTYHYQGTQTKVSTYRPTGPRDLTWTQRVGDANVSTGFRDASNAESRLVYENTYRPVQYRNRNNQTFTMTRNRFGNPLTVTNSRGIQWSFSYNYPANYPIDPIVSLAMTQIGYDGHQRTPTVYEFYQATNTAQGAIKGLLARVLSPRPGTSGTGEQVETHFYYTAMGNVALISAPGSNDEGRRLTTVFYYTVDPWGGGPFPERQNQPAAVAVYDKTLTLTDYNAIPTNPALRDDRLIFFERYRYDERGNVTQISDGAGFVTTFQYNSADQLTDIFYPADSLNGVQAREKLLYRYVGGPLYAIEVYNGSVLSRAYSFGAGSEGEARSIDNETARKADLGYDSHYRLSQVTGGLNSSTGQRHTTQNTYTEQNFVQSTIYPNNDTYTFSQHDNEGNPLQRLDAQGLITTFVRSLVDSRVEQVLYPDNTGNITVEYDGFNRISRLTRFVNEFNSSIITEYAYDDNDLITAVRTTYPGLLAREVSYTYYPDGSRATMNVAGAVFLYSYTYTTGPLYVSNQPFAGLQVRVRLPLVTTGFNLDSWYDQRGLLRRERTSNGVYREYHYNGRGLLTQLYNRDSLFPTSNRYADFTNLLYDAAGNLLQMQVSIPAFGSAPALQGTVYYSYDTEDRQTGERFALSNGTNLYSISFGYDPNDNPTSVRGISSASNAADQIANTGWIYQNGDLTRMVRFGEGPVLTYNREHQLIRYYNPNAAPPIDIRYFYRPDGLLAGRIGPNYFRWYLYDGDVPVAEIDGNNGSVVQFYAYSPDGLTQRFGPVAERRLYTFDPFGNVVHRVKFGQSYPNVLSVAWHDRLGATYLDRSSTGVDPFPTPDVLDGYLARFGQFRDPWTRPWNQADLTGLITTPYGTSFDPATGRFTSRTGGSQNPYARLYRPEKNFADANWNLVVAFAAWGYTSADPSASEGERFLAGLNALGRLLAVGSEWASYASAVPSRGGARAALREAGEEAGEKLARQGAKQAAREASEQFAKPTRGTRIYRVYGGEPMEADAWMRNEFSGPWGRYWTPIDPSTIRNYRDIAGLPPQNRGRFLIIAEIVDPTGIEVSRAAPVGGTRGGLIEYKIPNPCQQIRVLRVIGLNPPF